MATLPNYLVFDQANRFIAPIAEHDEATITWAWDKVGTGTISIPGDPPSDLFKAALNVHNSPALIEVQGVAGKRWTGRIHNGEYVDDGGDDGPMLELTLVNDRIWLDAMLAIVNPTGTMAQQGTAENNTRTGPTETVVKAYVAETAQRLGVPMVVVPAPSNDPSPIITLNARMTRLTDLIEDVLTPAGFGVEVVMHRAGRPIPDQWGGLEPADGTLVFDLVTGAYTPKLAWAENQLETFRIGSTEATGYRAITGGEGQGVERVFTEYVDTALRDQLGVYGLPEIYVDNSGTSGTEGQAGASADGVLSPSTAAALAAARGGLSVEFTVTDGRPWYAGVDWWLGDYGTATVAGEKFMAQITEVELQEKEGVVYAPTFGKASPSRPEAVAESVTRLAADIVRRRAQR